MQDRALVGNGHEVALVLRGALTEVGEVTGHVHGAHEVVGLGQVVDQVDADPGHPDHVEADGAVVGDLDTGGVLLQRRAGRSHEIGDDVHRLAGEGALHVALDDRPDLVGVAPVVVDALVLLAGGRDDGALLGACRVLAVAARIVETLTRRLDLARRKGLLDQAGVVGRADDLDPVRLQVLGPVLDVIAHRLVAQSSVVQHLVHVDHRCRPFIGGSRAISPDGRVSMDRSVPSVPRRSPPAGRHHRQGTNPCRHRRTWGIALCHNSIAGMPRGWPRGIPRGRAR